MFMLKFIIQKSWITEKFGPNAKWLKSNFLTIQEGMLYLLLHNKDIMKHLFLTLIFFLFTSSIFAADEKPGRFFEDQPDVAEFAEPNWFREWK